MTRAIMWRTLRDFGVKDGRPEPVMIAEVLGTGKTNPSWWKCNEGLELSIFVAVIPHRRFYSTLVCIHLK